MATIDAKFDTLFDRRAFVRHFVGDGMDEGEMMESRDIWEDAFRKYIMYSYKVPLIPKKFE